MLSPVKIWRNQKNLHTRLGKTGKIISWTVIRVPPEGFGIFAPYPVVIVELEDRSRMTVQMVDWNREHLKKSQKVVVVVRRACESMEDGVISYGLKVKPI